MKKELTVRKIVIFLTIILFLIFLHYTKILKPIESVTTLLLKPIQGPLYSFSTSFFDKKILKNKKELIEKNQELENKIIDLSIENSQLKNIIEENELFNEQSEFLKNNNYNYQPAKIISNYSKEDSQIIIIDQGTNNGLEKDMPVIAEKGVLIGKIIETENNIAKVLLLTSNLSEIGVQLQNKQNTPGILKGDHGLSLTMDLIPKENDLNTGDTIITSGIEEKMPKGLIVGNVNSVKNEAKEIFNSAKITPLIDYNDLTIVSVIL